MRAPCPPSSAPWLPLRDFFFAEALAAWKRDRQLEELPASMQGLISDEQISILCRDHWFAESLWRQLELIDFFAQRADMRAFVRRERGDKQFAFADAAGAWRSAELDAGQAFEWLLRVNGLDPERGSRTGQSDAGSLA